MTRFTFDDHIAEQPEAVAAMLDAEEPPALDPQRPIVFTGIGTSLHACRIAAGWTRAVTGGAVRPAALSAHDVALGEPLTPQDQVVVVSHRGTKRFPNEVLRRAAEVGCATVVVTGQGPAQPAADIVVRTCEQERASTHTVSYTAALAVLGRIVCATFGERSAELRSALDEAPAALARTLELPLSGAAIIALAESGPEPAVIAGSGLDAITAEEAALKIKEGTYRWAEGLETEFALHGTPAAFSSATTAFLIAPAAGDGGRDAALAQLLRALGARVLRSGDDKGADLPFASVHALARPLVAVAPFQRLVSAVAARVGADPDRTHVESEPWASAIASVEL